MKLVLIDNIEEQAKTFSEKLEALGFVPLVFKSFKSALEHRFTSEKIIFILNESLFRKYHDQLHLLRRTQSKTIFYILADTHNVAAPYYYAKGLDGVIDTEMSSCDMLEMLRKAALSRSLQWRVTREYSTKESVSWILSDLDDINDFKEIQFSQAGFALVTSREFSTGDKIKFSIQFKKNDRHLYIEGFAEFRFYNEKKKMNVFEFLTLNGNGHKTFMTWIDRLDSRERLLKAS